MGWSSIPMPCGAPSKYKALAAAVQIVNKAYLFQWLSCFGIKLVNTGKLKVQFLDHHHVLERGSREGGGSMQLLPFLRVCQDDAVYIYFANDNEWSQKCYMWYIFLMYKHHSWAPCWELKFILKPLFIWSLCASCIMTKVFEHQLWILAICSCSTWYQVILLKLLRVKLGDNRFNHSLQVGWPQLYTDLLAELCTRTCIII